MILAKDPPLPLLAILEALKLFFNLGYEDGTMKLLFCEGGKKRNKKTHSI